MKIKNDFIMVKTNKETIAVKQTITKIMNMEEAYNELKKLNQDMKQITNQAIDIKRQIENDFLQNKLKEVEENKQKIETLQKEWAENIKEYTTKLISEMKKKIKKEKIKRGYDRVNNTTKRIEMQNQIIGPICYEHNVEMDSNIVTEIKQKFDEI